ncbi:MAG: mevalonate kinase [Deltaproteobacteria bacterium]
MNRKSYSSKILLFGEYTVINGSDALAIPFGRFKGSWGFDKRNIQKILFDLADFIKKNLSGIESPVFKYNLFINDLNKGLFFDSDIPVGYGAGSSGALTAAVFDSYFIRKDINIYELKTNLARIEDFFHSFSSGIDPLVSYLNQIIKISHRENIEIVESDKYKFSNFSLYLIDSGKPRNTKTYVDIYKQKMGRHGFEKSFIEPHSNLSDSIIKSYLSNNEMETFRLFHDISELQYKELHEMIDPQLSDIWISFLNSYDGAIKLCGAGGGGFYLLMIKSDCDQNKILNDFKLLDI